MPWLGVLGLWMYTLVINLSRFSGHPFRSIRPVFRFRSEGQREEVQATRRVPTASKCVSAFFSVGLWRPPKRNFIQGAPLSTLYSRFSVPYDCFVILYEQFFPHKPRQRLHTVPPLPRHPVPADERGRTC